MCKYQNRKIENVHRITGIAIEIQAHFNQRRARSGNEIVMIQLKPVRPPILALRSFVTTLVMVVIAAVAPLLMAQDEDKDFELRRSVESTPLKAMTSAGGDFNLTGMIEEGQPSATGGSFVFSPIAQSKESKLSCCPCTEAALFADSFESGDTNAWTATVGK